MFKFESKNLGKRIRSFPRLLGSFYILALKHDLTSYNAVNVVPLCWQLLRTDVELASENENFVASLFY